MAPFTSKPAELLALAWRNRRDASSARCDDQAPTASAGRSGCETSRRRCTPVPASPRARRAATHVASLGQRGSLGVLPRLAVHAVGLPCPHRQGEQPASRRFRTASQRQRTRSTSSTATSGGSGRRANCRRPGPAGREGMAISWEPSAAVRARDPLCAQRREGATSFSPSSPAFTCRPTSVVAPKGAVPANDRCRHA